METIDFTRTIKAIEAYDVADERFCNTDWEAEVVLQELEYIESLAEAVGWAYGLDTADRNNPETCKQCVRPGTKVPEPGYELSFVRRMIRDFHRVSA